MKFHVTIKDIAKRLNISPSTVSRALSDHCDISTATKRKVLRMAEKLQYQPNSIAQSLKTSKTNVIGVIVPAIQNYFFSQIVSSIEKVLFDHGFTIIVCQSNESFDKEVINIQTLTSNRVAGLLIAVSQATKTYDHIKRLQLLNIPFVFFDRECNGIEVPKVTVDNYLGASQGVQYLVDRGYTKIAHLAGPQHISTSRVRFQAYCDVLKKNNISYKENYVLYGGFFECDGYTNTDRLLQQQDRPEVIFAVNDPVAFGAYKKIKELGYSIPRDIGLMGYDDIPFMGSLDPPVTTVHQPIDQIGYQAANMLLDRLGVEIDKKALSSMLVPELVVRKSV
jgi:LacI family transcriptional regulator